MRLQAVSTLVLALQGAVLALARSPIAARRPAGDDDVDDEGSTVPPLPDPNAINTNTPRVLLVSPTSFGNSSFTYNTCDSVYLWWFYDPSFAQQLDDTFNLTITNVGVNQNPPPPATTTSGTTSSPSGISSASYPGSFPPTNTGPPTATLPTQPPGETASPLRLFRRADVTMQLVHDQAIVTANHWFFWKAINVPSGYYVLKAVSTTGSSIPYIESPAFHIGQGSTSCFNTSTGGAGGGAGSGVPTGSDASQTDPATPIETASSGSNKTGVIVGAVVGTLLGLLAVAGLFFLFALRRRQQNAPRGGSSAWGQVASTDSRAPPKRTIGLPVGAVNRLSRNAEAAVGDSDSIEEKYMGGGGVSRSGTGSTGGHSTTAAFSPEPPMFRRHSQTSQAYPLGMLSTRESRRSTIQSIPTTVTPTNLTPLPSPSPVPAPGAALSRATSNATKKTPRKPVP
ncbi:hypothetical protein EXIGLDRAFT_833265, partial [Exidia glandulosa HHB12029]